MRVSVSHLREAALSLAMVLSSAAASAQDKKPPEKPSDLPIATDQQQQQQPQPQPQESMPIAVDPVPSSDEREALIVFVTIGVAPIVSRAGSPVSSTDGGGLFGFRAFAAGVDGSLALHVDIEGRLGAGSDGFLTRDRGVLLFGGNARLGDFGAFTMRAGAEARYVRSGMIEFGRILAPAMELGVYRFGSRSSRKLHIDLSAIGGLAAVSALRADNGVKYRQSLKPGLGGSLTVGTHFVTGRIGYLRALDNQFASDVDAALCFGQYISACIEGDHVVVDPLSGTFTTWRALLSLGVGIAWAE